MALEKERKFLIDVPFTWMGKFKALTADKVKIYQTYLKEPGVENSRVRSILHYGKDYPGMSYVYTSKKFISDGVNEEDEYPLTQEQFSSKLARHVDTQKNRIIKTRYYIDFHKHKRPLAKPFELDVFEDSLLGLAILEIELEDMAEKVITPPYLKVIKEVTNDRDYSNMNLARIDSYKDSLLFGTIKPKFPRRCD